MLLIKSYCGCFWAYLDIFPIFSRLQWGLHCSLKRDVKSIPNNLQNHLALIYRTYQFSTLNLMTVYNYTKVSKDFLNSKGIFGF